MRKSVLNHDFLDDLKIFFLCPKLCLKFLEILIFLIWMKISNFHNYFLKLFKKFCFWLRSISCSLCWYCLSCRHNTILEFIIFRVSYIIKWVELLFYHYFYTLKLIRINNMLFLIYMRDDCYLDIVTRCFWSYDMRMF